MSLRIDRQGKKDPLPQHRTLHLRYQQPPLTDRLLHDKNNDRKMEIAKSLVKCVARAFYDTKHILVIDALMIHNAYVLVPPLVVVVVVFFFFLTCCLSSFCAADDGSVRDDELGKLLGFQSKDLQKLCGRLKEDRMLTVWVSEVFVCGGEGEACSVGFIFYYFFN